MQYQSLISSIRRGVLSPAYLLWGEEEYLQQQALQALKASVLVEGTAAFNLDELAGSVTPAQVVERAITLPVFAEKRLVIVKNPFFLSSRKKEEGEEKAASQEQPLLSYLSDPLLTTCLVFVVYGSVDRRKKVFKALEKAGQVMELSALKGQELSDWLAQEAKSYGKRLEPRALEFILQNSGHNLHLLKNELEKMALRCRENKDITLAVAQEMLTKTQEANIFVLVDHLGLRQPEKALEELRQLLESGEPPARILFMIARHLRQILAAKEMSQQGFGEKQVAARLSLPPFVAGKVLRQGRNFSITQLEQGMELLLEGDIALKTGSQPRAVLENIVFSLVDIRTN